MKNQKIWKILAIVFVVIFALFVVMGLIRFYQSRSLFIKPTDTQIDYTKKIATDKLQSMGYNISSFQIKVSDRIRKGPTNVLQVSFYNDSTTHTYLVDAYSGKLIMYSKTEVYNKILNPPQQYQNEKHWYSWRPQFFGHDNEVNRR